MVIIAYPAAGRMSKVRAKQVLVRMPLEQAKYAQFPFLLLCCTPRADMSASQSGLRLSRYVM